MKHIKYINEDFSNDGYYTTIDIDTYGELLLSDTINMTDRDIEIITKDLKYKWRQDIVGRILGIKDSRSRVLVIYPESGSMVINKLDDYWFIVRITSVGNNEFSKYKCDHIEGLLKLLEDKGYLKMKHRRLVEGVNTNKYYQEISYEECEKLFGAKTFCMVRGEKFENVIALTEKELTKIKSLYNEDIIKFDRYQYETRIEETSSHMLNIRIGVVGYYNLTFEVVEYQNIAKLDDDWYILCHGGKGRKLTYYKCDQLEGLLKCMEDQKMKYP